MCTAATYKTKDFYFGRTLDYEFSYGDEVTITPRNYPIRFVEEGVRETHYAIIGMAHVANDYPLYYDAINEKGLGMAGLNFVGNAHYHETVAGKDNIAQFEFIPWILSQCATVKEAQQLVERINLLNTSFSPQLPVAQLHWMISDREESITVESVKDGIKIYKNPVGVLTNNPPFDMQLFHLNNYMGLSVKSPEHTFAKGLDLKEYSRGMGAMGLPGDLSSQSRFVRVAFTKMNSLSEDGENASVSQFFHILNSVDQQRGCCYLGDGKYEITLYTSCCNTDKGIYYYTTYDNHQITAVDMHKENLDGMDLIRYPLITEEQIRRQN
ncbi:MAG: choloylglycine hydrolase [Erysipelotrichaceae bacterium]|nr:choloylglycine hydrolase [Erysipelotrichaceae bacterium]